MGNDVTRVKEARSRTTAVLATIDQMGALPKVLAGEAVERTHYVLTPLRELEHIEIPEPVREAGTNVKQAAAAFAEAPSDAGAQAWALALRRLASVQDSYGHRMRDAARRAQTQPAKVVQIGDMSAGRLAQRELEKQGHRFPKAMGGRR